MTRPSVGRGGEEVFGSGFVKKLVFLSGFKHGFKFSTYVLHLRVEKVQHILGVLVDLRINLNRRFALDILAEILYALLDFKQVLLDHIGEFAYLNRLVVE